MQDRFDLAIGLARQAGDILMRGRGMKITPRYKGEIDPVTEFDLEAEAALIEGLRCAFPQDSILAEERGAMGDSSMGWIIDPLDGTVNFARGIPIFCVSIAWGVDGRTELGVVYDPVHQELFSARAGGGAWLNGGRIAVSERDHLAESLVATGFPYDIREDPDNNLDHFADLSLRSMGVRRLGAAALDLAYVAVGRFDAYWELRISPWDMAAGALLVQEAGGLVSRAEGRGDIFTEPTSILASNGRIHGQMLEVLDRQEFRATAVD